MVVLEDGPINWNDDDDDLDKMGKRRRRKRMRIRWGNGGGRGGGGQDGEEEEEDGEEDCGGQDRGRGEAGEVCFGNRSRGGFCPHWSLVIGAHWCNTTALVETLLNSSSVRTPSTMVVPWYHGEPIYTHSNWIHGVRMRWDGWDDLSGSNRTTPPSPHSQICVFSIIKANHCTAYQPLECCSLLLTA